MRIALVDPAGFTPPYDHSLATALAHRGHDVHLFTSPAGHAVPAPEGYRRHETFLRRSSRMRRRRLPVRTAVRAVEYVPSVRRSTSLVRRLGPDIVHVQWLPLPRYDVSWLRDMTARFPTLLTAHDVLPRRASSAKPWGEALGHVDRVVVHSGRAVEQLVELGVARRRLERIPHPVFESSADRAPSPPAGTTLLFFGLIRHYKGLDVLLRALPRLRKAVPAARLVVAGRPLEPAEPLRALAASLGAADAVEWRLRYVEEPELGELFDAAALVVLPYRELDASGVLATALGRGRPAVVTDVGSLGDIVREFQAGAVVPPEDPDALADACARLLTDHEALQRAGRGAMAARESLTWGASAAAHEQLYATVREERS